MTLLNTSYLKGMKMVEQSQPWFKVYDLDRRVYAICEPYQKQHVVSYLIIGDTDAILLDTGLGVGNIKKLVFELWSIKPTIINTNACLGHCGGNDKFELVKIVNEPKIIDAMTFGFDDDWTKKHYGPESFSDDAPKNYDETNIGFKSSNFSTVSNGDHIYLGASRTFEVISPDAIKVNGLMLADHEEKLLFTGDIFYEDLINNLQGSEKEAYLAELSNICKEYGDYTWYFSHGYPQDEKLKGALIAKYSK